METLEQRIHKWRRKEFTDGTKPSERLVLMLDKLSEADEETLRRFRDWVKDQPDNRETQILKWCAIYRGYELKRGTSESGRIPPPQVGIKADSA
jgi:hypothetical protein